MTDSLVILKLPALVAAMISLYINCTAPNPPPKRERDAKLSAWDRTATMARSAILVILRNRFYCIGVQQVLMTGIIFLVSGAALREVYYNTLGRYFTYQLAILKDHKLVTWGPYSVVRHPAYTACAGMLVTEFSPGGWLMESGVLDASWAKAVMAVWVAYAILVIIVVVQRIPMEDELMKEFGEEWEKWSRKTPYALLPYVY